MGRRQPLSIKHIVAIGIGAALFFVLGRFVAIPSPVPNTTINIQYAILAVFGILYGPRVGLFVGLIGHTLIDLSWGSPWWSWIIASAVFGFLIGCGSKLIAINEGEFGGIKILMFQVMQIVSHIIAWGVVAPTLDILIYNEPTNKLFAQGIFAGMNNAISTGIVGTMILVSYAKTKTKPGSLRKEE